MISNVRKNWTLQSYSHWRAVVYNLKKMSITVLVGKCNTKWTILFVFMAIADYLFSIKHEKLQMKLSKARSWSHFYNNFVM